jgi:hypothetical protein
MSPSFSLSLRFHLRAIDLDLWVGLGGAGGGVGLERFSVDRLSFEALFLCSPPTASPLRRQTEASIRQQVTSCSIGSGIHLFETSDQLPSASLHLSAIAKDVKPISFGTDILILLAELSHSSATLSVSILSNDELLAFRRLRT